MSITNRFLLLVAFLLGNVCISFAQNSDNCTTVYAEMLDLSYNDEEVELKWYGSVIYRPWLKVRIHYSPSELYSAGVYTDFAWVENGDTLIGVTDPTYVRKFVSDENGNSCIITASFFFFEYGDLIRFSFLTHDRRTIRTNFLNPYDLVTDPKIIEHNNNLQTDIRDIMTSSNDLIRYVDGEIVIDADGIAGRGISGAVYGADGRKVANIDSSTQRIPTSGWHSGVYMVHLRSGREVSTKKILVK